MICKSFTIVLYFCIVNCEQEDPNNDLHVIIDTQHAYCTKSSHCPWIGNEHSNLTFLNEIWHNQIILDRTDCCETCSCVQVTCKLAGNCCPEIFNNYETFSKAYAFQKSYCMPLQLKPRSSQNDNKIYPNTRDSVVIFSKCHEAYTNDALAPRRKRDEIKQKCENENIDDIFTKIPVTHGQPQLTFRNKYCAECYGLQERELSFWDLQIVCNGSTIKNIRMDTVLPLVLEKDECNIFFYSQDWLPIAEHCSNHISACNVTGKWASYDAVIETACGAFSSPYMNAYKNIFCYMCNGEIMDPRFCNIFSIDKTEVTFSMVVKYGEMEKLDGEDEFLQDICPRHTVYDELQKSCIAVYCQDPKIYVNGSCVNIVTRIGGVGYRVFLQLTRVSGNQLQRAEEALETYFLQLFDTIGLGKYIYTFSLHIKRGEAISRIKSVNYFVLYFEFYLPPREPEEVTLIDRVYEMHESIFEVNVDGILDPQAFYARLEYFDIQEKINTDIYLTQWDITHNDTFTLEKYQDSEYVKPYIHGLTTFNMKDITYLLPTYKCPLVTLNSSYYGIQHFPWGINLVRSAVKLNKTEYISNDNDEGSVDIGVCQQTFHFVNKKALESMASGAPGYSVVILLLYVHTLYICGASFF